MECDISICNCVLFVNFVVQDLNIKGQQSLYDKYGKVLLVSKVFVYLCVVVF
jgi:hypothetical protein